MRPFLSSWTDPPCWYSHLAKRPTETSRERDRVFGLIIFTAELSVFFSSQEGWSLWAAQGASNYRHREQYKNCLIRCVCQCSNKQVFELNQLRQRTQVFFIYYLFCMYLFWSFLFIYLTLCGQNHKKRKKERKTIFCLTQYSTFMTGCSNASQLVITEQIWVLSCITCLDEPTSWREFSFQNQCRVIVDQWANLNRLTHTSSRGTGHDSEGRIYHRSHVTHRSLWTSFCFRVQVHTISYINDL